MKTRGSQAKVGLKSQGGGGAGCSQDRSGHFCVPPEYVHEYTCVHACAHTRVHARACTCVHLGAQVSVCMLACERVPAWVSMDMSVCSHLCTSVHPLLRVGACFCVFKSLCAHTRECCIFSLG